MDGTWLLDGAARRDVEHSRRPRHKPRVNWKLTGQIFKDWIYVKERGEGLPIDLERPIPIARITFYLDFCSPSRPCDISFMKFHRSFLPGFNRSSPLRRISFEIEITKNEAATLCTRTLARVIQGDGTKGEGKRKREREWLYLKFDATKRDE